jgi:hypothetical protein
MVSRRGGTRKHIVGVRASFPDQPAKEALLAEIAAIPLPQGDR